MTAAHCADGAISARVVIGAHNVDQSESEAQEITATEFVVHELWNWNNLHNDIALVKLPEPAILSGNRIKKDVRIHTYQSRFLKYFRF